MDVDPTNPPSIALFRALSPCLPVGAACMATPPARLETAALGKGVLCGFA